MAFYGSVVLVIVLYVLVALVTVGTVPEARIAAVKDYALAEAARPALGALGFTLVAVSALLATFSAINATVYGNARLGYILARDRELPDILAHRAWNEPVSGVIAVGVLAALVANLVDITAIAIVASAGFLLVFAVANAAAVRLAPRTGGSAWVPLVGAVACISALGVLLARTYADNPHALWIFVGFLVGALLFELFYSRLRHGHLRGSPMRWPAGRADH